MAIVSFEWTPDRERPQTTWEEREAQLRALDELPDDEDIDCSDIPEITDLDGWMNAQEFKDYLAARCRQEVTS